MPRPNYRVVSFEIIAPYTLRVRFDDATEQAIDFEPVLAGVLFGPLRDLAVFNQVQIDPEGHTLVWPIGADFDPGMLHDWPQHAEELKARAQEWVLELGMRRLLVGAMFVGCISAGPLGMIFGRWMWSIHWPSSAEYRELCKRV